MPTLPPVLTVGSLPQLLSLYWSFLIRRHSTKWGVTVEAKNLSEGAQIRTESLNSKQLAH